MSRFHLLPLLALCLSLALPVLPASAKEDHPANSITDLAWLVGTWEGEHFGDKAVVTFLPPIGGVMHSVYRVVNSEGVCFINEFDILQETATGLVYHWSVYYPDLTPLMETPFGDYHGRYDIVNVTDHSFDCVDPKGGPMKHQTISVEGDLMTTEVDLEIQGEVQHIVFTSTRAD